MSSVDQNTIATYERLITDLEAENARLQARVEKTVERGVRVW